MCYVQVRGERCATSEGGEVLQVRGEVCATSEGERCATSEGRGVCYK